jgi:hypothetical protein
MSFTINMGVPDMDYYWNDMSAREAKGELSKGELKTFKKLIKAFYHLSENPKYPGLNSHVITALSDKAGLKIWQSYIENNTCSRSHFLGIRPW